MATDVAQSMRYDCPRADSTTTILLGSLLLTWMVAANALISASFLFLYLIIVSSLSFVIVMLLC